MPLTSQGKRTLEDFTKRYGPKKGKNIFYAMINEGKLKKMETKKKVSKVWWCHMGRQILHM